MSSIAVLSFDNYVPLTDERVAMIRKLWGGNLTLAQLAKAVGVTESQINNARRPRGPLHGLPRLPNTRPKREFTADEVAAIFQMWNEGVPTNELCRRIGVANHIFEARRKPGEQLANLPRRAQGFGGGNWCRKARLKPDWSGIADRILEVQRSWSEEERQFRFRAGRLPDAYRPRESGTREFADAPARGMISNVAMRAATDPKFW
jgi:hypothetical protein